jgi:hypothetical protein
VQHRHPYTKSQSSGANDQYPHETTSAHDQNLLCASRLSRFGITPCPSMYERTSTP